jgi:Tol biopolymer transport system component
VPGYVPGLIVRDLETGKETTIEPPSNSHCAISGDGSRIAFTSLRASMAPEDQNDVYVADVATQQLTRITDGTAYVFAPSISEDGRRIAFATKAALDPADTNDDFDVYVRDLDTGKTSWLSADTGISYGAAFTPDGDHVAFSAFDTSYTCDLRTGIAHRLSDKVSFGVASFTADGTKLLVVSNAADLVVGDTNRSEDVFLATLTPK